MTTHRSSADEASRTPDPAHPSRPESSNDPQAAGPNPGARPGPSSFTPPGVPAMLRQRRLLPGESLADSDALTEAVCEAFAPRNVLEFLTAKHLADQIWLEARHERIRTAHLDLETLSATKDLIDGALRGRYPHWDDRKPVVEQIHANWLAGTPAGRKDLENLLAGAGQSFDMAQARAFTRTMKEQSAFDALARSSTRQRRESLAELETIRRLTSAPEPSPIGPDQNPAQDPERHVSAGGEVPSDGRRDLTGLASRHDLTPKRSSLEMPEPAGTLPPLSPRGN
jgi:hypothetical protein